MEGVGQTRAWACGLTDTPTIYAYKNNKYWFDVLGVGAWQGAATGLSTLLPSFWRMLLIIFGLQLDMATCMQKGCHTRAQSHGQPPAPPPSLQLRLHCKNIRRTFAYLTSLSQIRISKYTFKRIDTRKSLKSCQVRVGEWESSCWVNPKTSVDKCRIP